ncbi:dipeptide/oligopeptide/nickel ABC transporter ATP-binding protein [Sphaerisporangium melleum]|uniref:Dipeptide/oligopeptide/nickel ABC transporter ATP-binding protein n=1 Tax=Sphaerisporangium melleum TaxID=321316 RepID=A0A917R2Q9_9ACTN|nr:ABC transporter ATP-binding protein [Sphaerisporangium melleum]GGK84861.1 dipeptide/oligopeptide/nickel ABC transporter ATP-binding protein [Sphaerisporangium melleum]GII70463.1 dipeptide/oligopeptide/nickel ABC transporter ATP-binding protein [Sphaerisporangium melleum]
MSVLSVRDLSVVYGGPRPTHAVRGVSLELDRGEVLGIAGESGCGKSTLAYALTRLLRPPASVTGGEIVFRAGDGEEVDVLALRGEELRRFRWRRIAMVFQSAMNALNPVISVRRQLADVLATHEPGMSRRAREERCGELLDLVGIDRARLSSYPHELSGGMRQRVLIAMAMALNPDVVVLDEPTTALDVVVQREILQEIDRLRAMFGFAVVFITHDLSLLLEISDRLAVMYGGRIVESGTARDLMAAPAHPYTVGLLGSFPSLRGERRVLHGIPGSPPDLSLVEPGCSFAPRCPYAFDACGEVTPAPLPVGATTAACLQHDRTLRPAGPDPGLAARRFTAEDAGGLRPSRPPGDPEPGGHQTGVRDHGGART